MAVIQVNNKMKNLIIIGASGFGREVYSWACAMQEYNIDWYINGFIDDNLNALAGYDYPIPILSTIKDYIPKTNDVFVCAIGNPNVKQACVDTVRNNGGRIFVNIIHPTVIISKNVVLGQGVIFCPMSSVNADAWIGNFVTLNSHTSVGHDSIIGDWSQINSYCDITGNVKIGTKVFIGSNASVLPGLKVGDNARIGAGSIVIKNVDENLTVFGNPAKKITF